MAKKYIDIEKQNLKNLINCLFATIDALKLQILQTEIKEYTEDIVIRNHNK